jgi:peptide/nickel transport system permease protein
LVLALAVVVEPNMAVLVLLIGSTGWMGASRVIRAEILSLRQREFAIAAQGLGLSPLRLYTRHLLPNALTPLLVILALQIGETILLESTLSFLGVGIAAPHPSWGNMISDGRGATLALWWVPLFPGLALVSTLLGFNLLADGLRDALDPRQPRELRLETAAAA